MCKWRTRVSTTCSIMLASLQDEYQTQHILAPDPATLLTSIVVSNVRMASTWHATQLLLTPLITVGIPSLRPVHCCTLVGM